CFANLRAGGVRVLLSNSHVIFDANAAPPTRIGSPSAGSCRCCCPKNIVARATTPGVHDNVSGTFVDGAIALLEPGFTGINRITGLTGTSAGQDTSLSGLLQGTATVSDHPAVFVCTSTSSLPHAIIPCTVRHASADVPIDASHSQRGQIVLEVAAGFEQDIVSGTGDSGSIVVDQQNRVVGLMHSRGSSAAGGAIGELSNTIIASPIQAVMNALQIDIPVQAPVPPSAGPVIEDLPFTVEEAGIADPDLFRFQRLIKQSEIGRFLHGMGFRYGPEVVELVHKRRAVTVAWRRNEGPAWAAHVINSARDPEYRLPERVNGITQMELLSRMGEALQRHGSAELRADIEQYGATVIALAGFRFISEMLSRIGITEA